MDTPTRTASYEEQQQQQSQTSSRVATTSPSHSNTPTAITNNNLLRSQDVARLMSRMSVSKPIARSEASLSPEKPADRTLTVSPEPPGPRHGLIHQVSEQNLNVGGDIYGATPRLDSATSRPSQDRNQRQGEEQERERKRERDGVGHGEAMHENINTKYASGSEKGHGAMNGAAAGVGLGVIAGVAAAAAAAAAASAPPAVVTEDKSSFFDGPDSDPESTPDETKEGETPQVEKTEAEAEAQVSPPQQAAAMHMNVEPEEKILVDLPVELAAVNDLDDGIPMMSATSYPGQEWNPYGAGEFGAWE